MGNLPEIESTLSYLILLVQCNLFIMINVSLVLQLCVMPGSVPNVHV